MVEITAKSNNFGAGAITFKTLQNENHIILTGEVHVDTSNPAYLAADVLEISVPSLSIKKSAISAVPMLAAGELPRQGTYAKTWIKDRNTICVEKISVFDSYGSFDLYFAAAYVQIGARPPFTRLTAGYMSIISDGECVINCTNDGLGWTDEFMYVGAHFRQLQGHPDGSPWSIPLSGKGLYPVKVALVMQSTDASKPGNPFYILRLEGTRLHFENFPYYPNYTVPRCGLTAFAIRNGEDEY